MEPERRQRLKRMLRPSRLHHACVGPLGWSAFTRDNGQIYVEREDILFHGDPYGEFVDEDLWSVAEDDRAEIRRALISGALGIPSVRHILQYEHDAPGVFLGAWGTCLRYSVYGAEILYNDTPAGRAARNCGIDRGMLFEYGAMYGRYGIPQEHRLAVDFPGGDTPIRFTAWCLDPRTDIVIPVRADVTALAGRDVGPFPAERVSPSEEHFGHLAHVYGDARALLNEAIQSLLPRYELFAVGPAKLR